MASPAAVGAEHYMADRIVTVFGGTGFLGRRVVRHLLDQNLSARIASRHPQRVPRASEQTALRSMRADINDEDAVATAVAGAYGVVNAVSLYLERRTETYHTVHVEAADGSHAKHGVRALSGSYMFRGSEPISPRARSTYVGEVRVNWLCKQHLQTRSSFAPP